MKGRLAVVVGDVVNDVVVRPLEPIAAGTDTPADVAYLPGGSGANQAAWLGALGNPVRFVGRAGAVDVAMHRRALELHGVEARIAADDDSATGTIVVLVGPSGERSMFTDRGASLSFSARDAPDEVLAGAALLHVSAYTLFADAPREAILRLWAAALDAGVPASVDPSSLAGLMRYGPAAFLDWTDGAEIVFPNEDEGRFLTGRENPHDVAGALLERYPTVALKLGAAGAVVASRAGGHIRVRAPAADVVDTTGAGDAFAAGFLAAWLTGCDLEGSAAKAVATAARAVAEVGARPPPPAPS